MKVTLAFEKNSKTIYARLIKWWTQSEYSHVEMIIEDKWIASGSNCCEGVRIKELKPLKSTYDYIEVEVDGRRLKRVMKFIESQEGTKYDYLGMLFGGGLDIPLDEKDKWFCSELIAEILTIFKQKDILGTIPSTLSPEDLYQIYC